MSTQKKVRVILFSCFILSLVLILVLSLLLPNLMRSTREQMGGADEEMFSVYEKRIKNFMLASNLMIKVLNLLYVLIPVLAAIAYKSGCLSKAFLGVCILTPWVVAFLAHGLPYLGIRPSIFLHLIVYILTLPMGLFGAILVLAFLPIKRPPATDLS